MQLGGALANEIVLGELPSAAGHVVSPVTVAPAIVLGSGVNVVVGAFGSIVVPGSVVEANGSTESEVTAAEFSPRVTSLTIPYRARAAKGSSNTYMPLRLRFCVRA